MRKTNPSSRAAEAETDNSPGALRRETREATIESIRGYLPFILDDPNTDMEDLRVLRDILDYAHSMNNSIFTGVGHALSRHRSDVVWVPMEHHWAVTQFAAQLEERSEAGKGAKE